METCQNQDLFKDFEMRLRQLETDRTELKIYILSLDNNVKDLKILMNETNKTQSDIISKIVENRLEIDTTNTNNIWSLAFKIGAVFAPFLSAALAVYLK